MTRDELFLEALAALQQTAEHHRQVVEDLRKAILPTHSPALLKTVILTSQNPATSELPGHGSQSFSLLNPNGVSIRLGVAGLSAGNVAAIQVPRTSGLTLPVSGANLEIAANPSDVASADAIVHILFYDGVQPFALFDA